MPVQHPPDVCRAGTAEHELCDLIDLLACENRRVGARRILGIGDGRRRDHFQLGRDAQMRDRSQPARLVIAQQAAVILIAEERKIGRQ